MAEGGLFEIVIILVLTLANGFFAASEIAVVSARKGRLAQQADAGQRGAAVALRLAENPNRFLSTVQVGITLISTFAAAFGGASLSSALAKLLGGVPALAPYASSLALGIVVVALSYVSLIVGELVPKRLALQSAERIAAAVAPVMSGIARLASPLVSFLTFSTELVLRLLGRHNVAETPVTEDDIRALVREGAAEGTVAADEERLIDRVFHFTARSVRALMTPRTQVAALAADAPIAEVIRLVTESGYSRLPVYEGTLDRVVGILYVKDLFQAWGRGDALDLRALLRPALYVLEGQRATAAFQQLKQQRSALAVVLDEYGQVAGVVSMEDMLEELVGDISDEYDEADETIVRRADGSYLVDGLLPFVDLRARLGLPEAETLLQTHSFETAAGLVLALLGHIPTASEHVTWAGYRFEVVDMDGRRIDKILLTPPPTVPDATAQSEAALASGAVSPPTP